MNVPAKSLRQVDAYGQPSMKQTAKRGGTMSYVKSLCSIVIYLSFSDSCFAIVYLYLQTLGRILISFPAYLYTSILMAVILLTSFSSIYCFCSYHIRAISPTFGKFRCTAIRT